MKFTWVIIGAVFLAGTPVSASSRSVFSSDFVRELHVADRVEAVKILPGTGGDAPEGRESLDGYPIVEVGPTLTQVQADRVLALLVEPSGYLLQGLAPLEYKLCEFMPRHGLKFWMGETVCAEAVVCFSCETLYVRSRLSWARTGGYFDPMYSALLDLFVECFPDDSVLSALQSN